MVRFHIQNRVKAALVCTLFIRVYFRWDTVCSYKNTKNAFVHSSAFMPFTSMNKHFTRWLSRTADYVLGSQVVTVPTSANCGNKSLGDRQKVM